MASARLPQALIDRVEDWATTSGASRSGAIRKSSRTAGVLVARAGRVAPARAIEGQQETRRRVDEVVALFWKGTANFHGILQGHLGCHGA
jgi:1,6-anhydro-N-acetylmuramate kinase